MLRCFAVMRCGTSTESPRSPVAGSSITDSGLLGEWCAEVFLDDEEAPIARRRFDLLVP